MAALQCDICGGKLVMGAGGIATCDSCGMEHSTDRMKEKVQEIKGAVTVSNIADITSLMKRGWLLLEDSDWKQADEYFNKALDIDPEHAPAYVGKLCAELQVRNEGALPHTMRGPFDLSLQSDYEKTMRFGDVQLIAKMKEYNQVRKEHFDGLPELCEIRTRYPYPTLLDDVKNIGEFIAGATGYYSFSDGDATYSTNSIAYQVLRFQQDWLKYGSHITSTTLVSTLRARAEKLLVNSESLVPTQLAELEEKARAWLGQFSLLDQRRMVYGTVGYPEIYNYAGTLFAKSLAMEILSGAESDIDSGRPSYVEHIELEASIEEQQQKRKTQAREWGAQGRCWRCGGKFRIFKDGVCKTEGCGTKSGDIDWKYL